MRKVIFAIIALLCVAFFASAHAINLRCSYYPLNGGSSFLPIPLPVFNLNSQNPYQIQLNETGYTAVFNQTTDDDNLEEYTIRIVDSSSLQTIVKSSRSIENKSNNRLCVSAKPSLRQGINMQCFEYKLNIKG